MIILIKADETDSGETRYIPAGIMKLSIAQKAEIAEISVSTDSMLQVVWTILHAMKIEEAAMQANITHAWSPQTAQDLRGCSSTCVFIILKLNYCRNDMPCVS